MGFSLLGVLNFAALRLGEIKSESGKDYFLAKAQRRQGSER